jgi:hypothetical protein
VLASIVIGAVVVCSTSVAAAGTGGAPPLTKRRWIRAADRICRDADRAIEAAPEPSANLLSDELTAADFQEYAALLQTVTSTIRNALRELRALKPPRDDRALVKLMLGALRGAASAGDEAVAAANAADQEALVAGYQEIGERSDAFEKGAGAYGSRCGRSSERT